MPIVPVFHCRRIASALAFYTTVLDFDVVSVDDPDGNTLRFTRRWLD